MSHKDVSAGIETLAAKDSLLAVITYWRCSHLLHSSLQSSDVCDWVYIGRCSCCVEELAR